METQNLSNKTLNAHTGNGWNYGIQFSKTKFRIFRYHTNGHQNSSNEYREWMPIDKLDNLISEDEFDNIDYLDQDHWNNMDYVEQAGETLQRLFHTAFFYEHDKNGNRTAFPVGIFRGY